MSSPDAIGFAPAGNAPGGGLSDLAAQAEERRRRSDVLARLVVAEPGDDECELVRAIPSLAAAFSSPDELRARYQAVMVDGVACYESVFRRYDGQMGSVDPALLDLYRGAGFEWEGRWRVAAPDHLGVELACYAHLCAWERDGWADDHPERATEAVEAQRRLLADHVGHWGPVATEALLRVDSAGAYGILAGFVDSFLETETRRLRPAAQHPGMPPVDEGPAEARFTKGPRLQARRLLAPARSGGYLSNNDIAALAREIGTPWRPSDRRSRLAHVLEVAAGHDTMDAVSNTFAPIVRDWERRWAHKREEIPGAWRTYEQWRRRAEATVTWLESLSGTANSEAAPSVLTVSSSDELAAALASLSGAGLAVSVWPAPGHVLDRVDAIVRLAPDGVPGWDRDPPIANAGYEGRAGA